MPTGNNVTSTCTYIYIFFFFITFNEIIAYYVSVGFHHCHRHSGNPAVNTNRKSARRRRRRISSRRTHVKIILCYPRYVYVNRRNIVRWRFYCASRINRPTSSASGGAGEASSEKKDTRSYRNGYNTDHDYFSFFFFFFCGPVIDDNFMIRYLRSVSSLFTL